MRKHLLLAICLSVLATPGCMVVRHDFTAPDGSHDKGSIAAFMTATKAAKLNTRSKYKDYNHSSGATELDARGDVEMFKAIFEAGVAVGKKAAGIP